MYCVIPQDRLFTVATNQSCLKLQNNVSCDKTAQESKM